MTIVTNHTLKLNVCCASKAIATAAVTLLTEATARDSGLKLGITWPPVEESDVAVNRHCFAAQIDTPVFETLEIFELQAKQALAFLGVEVA